VVAAVSVSAGKIICMSSVHDVIPWAGHVNYASSKGGVMMLMKSMAQECAPWRIRVNSICPGAIRTPINTEAWAMPEAYNDLMKLVPYNRIGEPEDIGSVAVFLASDMADYITGTNLYVDGGTAKLTHSEVASSTTDGIKEISGTTVINSSTIHGNVSHGVMNVSGVSLNAQSNYWGASNGPSGVGPGSGDAVSVDVDYTGWLSSWP